MVDRVTFDELTEGLVPWQRDFLWELLFPKPPDEYEVIIRPPGRGFTTKYVIIDEAWNEEDS